ncbi:MAG TPA: GAF domain-containing protein [Candidatus Methylomirabilis sp.]|nr:GAF domain-containing protein [Candidatus Methylomirabilis sp.]
MPSGGQQLQLRRQLARRLAPVTFAIVGLISLGTPAAYYMLEADDVQNRATTEARELADRLGPLLVDVPALWKYQGPKYRQLLDEYIRHRQVTSIQVRDASGALVPEYTFRMADPPGGWTAPASFGTAPLFANNQRMGSVSLGISHMPLMWATLRLFVLSTAVGVSLALVAYLYPIKVVKRLEAHIDDLVDALEERTRQLEAVRAVAIEITREPDFTTVFKLISQRAGELVGAVSGTVWLWDDKVHLLVPVAWHGVGDWMREWRLRLGEGISGRVAQLREGLIINDFRTSPYASSVILERTGITAVLAEPLLYRDRLLGVLTVHHQEAGKTFSERDREILTLFAAQAAVGMENALSERDAKRKVAS